MGILWELIDRGGGVALVVSLVGAAIAAAAGCGRLSPCRHVLPYLFACALAAGWLSHSRLSAIPQRPTDWMLYAVVAAAILGPLLAGGEVPVWERGVALAALSVWVAWKYVPDWADLQPPRPVWVGQLAAYLLLVGCGLLPLARDPVAGRLLPLACWASGLLTALAVASAVSLRHGQLGMLGTAAFTGPVLFAYWRPSEISRRSVIPAILCASAACGFAGAVEPQPPLRSLMLLPALPLLLWLAPAWRWCAGRREA